MIYSRDTLPHPVRWEEFVKITTTKAVRMDGYFEVWTREGLMSCEDGWLALDSGGNPYPIAAEEFARIYRPAEGQQVYGGHRVRRAEPCPGCPSPVECGDANGHGLPMLCEHIEQPLPGPGGMA